MLAFLLIIKFWRHSNAQARNREAIQYLLFFLFLSQKHPFYPSSDSTQQSGRFARTVQHQHTAEWQICAHNTASIHSRVAGLHARTVCVACHSHVHQRTHTVCAPKSTHCMCTKEHTLYVHQRTHTVCAACHSHVHQRTQHLSHTFRPKHTQAESLPHYITRSTWQTQERPHTRLVPPAKPHGCVCAAKMILYGRCVSFFVCRMLYLRRALVPCTSFFHWCSALLQRASLGTEKDADLVSSIRHASSRICRVGQNHVHSVCTVFLAGKSPNIWSPMVYIYGNGQHYTFGVLYTVRLV
jgi:hypothetical protein